jgi:hypothetical protein
MASVVQGFDQYQDDGGELLKQQENGNAADKKSSKNSEKEVQQEAQQVYKFKPKNQLSTKNNPLCGICLPQWLTILWKRKNDIEWTTYWPRLVVITLLSCLNSFLAIPEYFLYETQIQQTTINPRPVFILGHPRTGTTLLHSLLALDAERFAVCTTFCSGFPSCFLWFESLGKRLFANVMDDHRPMDNVKLHFDLPQEDELATTNLSAGVSPYMPLFFMNQELKFRPYYAFDDDAAAADESLPGPEMAKARTSWTDSFLYLLRKLTLRASMTDNTNTHRLLLKSPVHTARIPLLLSLFPDAEFIYIHRHPHDVFRSAAHMADTTYWYTYLNTPSNGAIQEFILRQYEILWDRYEAGRLLLRPNQLTEVSFDSLSNQPIESVREMYHHFQWSGWEEMETKLQDELGDVKAYKKNQHASLSPALQQIVNERWGPSFDRLGYDRRRESS